MTSREAQRRATRKRILDAAADLLIARGCASLSTVAVQKAADVSRGSLLHHFPNLSHLLEALVAHLVARNERIANEALRDLPEDLDPVSRAVQALYEALAHPAFQAELELWASARTDTVLRAHIRDAERRAERDLHRVIDAAFGEDITTRPGYPLIAELTIMLTRGLAISRPLHAGNRSNSRLIEHWARLVRDLLEQESPTRPAARTRHSLPSA